MIVASSVRERIGTVHEAAGRIMAGEVSEYAVSVEEAKASAGLMREGFSMGIDFSGQRVISFGIAGPLDAVTPLARIVGFCVRSILQAREVERKIVARHADDRIAATNLLVEDMRIRAATDFLTGTWNRSRLEELANSEIDRLNRYGHPVSLIFADLDRFKLINDTYGHAAGDRVLRGFCAVVRDCIRSLDSVGRWGGEEFVIVMPNSTLAVADLLARRIRETLRNYDFGPLPRVSASFGVAECQAGESFDSWVARADAAMYQAKKEGRDRVVLAQGIRPSETDQLGSNFVRLVWHKHYECGHPRLDAQHRTLFEMANNLLDSVINRQPGEAIAMLIEQLITEAKAHFTEEEAFLKRIDYPGLSHHVQQHDALVDKADGLMNLFAKGLFPIGDVFSFLAYDLVAIHMLSEDRPFFSYMPNPPVTTA